MSRMSANVCKEHPNAQLIDDSRAGDIICTECGLVVGDRVIDVSSEWRTFANDEGKDRSRVGGAQSSLLNSSDLSTVMQNPGGKHGWDIGGSSIYKNRRQNEQDTKEERNLKNGYNEIAKICERGHYSKMISQRAKEIFKMVYDGKVLRGNKPAGTAAACIFISFRNNSVARSIKEVCAVAQIEKKDLSAPFTKIMKSLPELNAANKQGGTEDYVDRHINQMGIDGKEGRRLGAIAKEISSKLDESGIADGRSPLSKTAACLYLAFHVMYNSDPQKISGRLQQICRIIGVAEATVRTIYKIINAEKGLIDNMILPGHKAGMSKTPQQLIESLH